MTDPRVKDVVSVVARGRPRKGRITQVGKTGTGFAGFAQITWPDGSTCWRMVGGLTLVKRGN